MMLKKASSWLVTENGRKFAFGCVLTGGMGAFCARYVPNTFLIDQYQSAVHLYKNGISVPLSQKLIDRFNKTLELAEISEAKHKFYRAFTVIGFDIFSAGCAYSKYGCIIGLPTNFTYTSPETIDKTNIKLLGESIVWEKPEAQEFLQSMVLSEKAQMYAIAREMRMSDTLKLYFDSFLTVGTVVLAYTTCHIINTRMNYYAKPRSIRIGLYALVGGFTLGNYFFIKDAMQLYYERRADEELKHLNPIFAEGAIEFYTKILARNRSLRKLMGRQGEATYSVLGNENYMLRQRHLPLVQRKSYFENTLDPKQSLIENVIS